MKILISGAGIAGPTLAYWLAKGGHETTIVERAPALRLGGQNIDISDAAVAIVKKMGIEPAILAHNTTEEGLLFVNEQNETEAAFPKGGATSFTSQYEILRGDLGQILYDLTKEKTSYRFGEEIETLDSGPEAVAVKFRFGAKESYDLVIAADGVSSRTRAQIVDDKNAYKYLGVYTSYLTVPKRPTDTRWARWHNAPGGKVFLIRPDNKGTTRASINFWWSDGEEKHLSRKEALALLREVLRGVGWEAPRLAADLEKDPDIYLGPVSQVRLDRWSNGRCALVGDAAYCPTPFTGMGTTLAIIGAYILAGELTSNADYEQAFASYEAKFKPFVQEIQRVIPGQFRLVYPQSRLGVFALNKVARLFGSKLVQQAIARLKGGEKKPKPAFALPHYEI